MTGLTFYFEWEVRLMEWLQSMMGSVAVTLASFITLFGEETVMVLVLAFLYFCYDKEFGKFIGENITLAMVLNPMIKNIFVRRRPYFDNPGVKCLKRVNSSADQFDIAAQGFSFPSAHSTDSIVVYGSFPIYIAKNKRKGFRMFLIIAIVLPILVGISRFSLGVHYPTDVMMGWLLGGICLVFMTFLQSKFGGDSTKKHRMHLVIFLIAALGIIYCRSNDYFTGLGVMAGLYMAEYVEEKYINFEKSGSILESVLRLLVGGAIYFGLNAIIKLPFSEEFRSSATLGAFLFRFIRYTIASFILLGVYPIAFNKIKKKAPTKIQN
ncbi:PAP2 superfamily protein [Lachnospiraceae bacterium NE2001]|nr:PAP2 superfamily protein [Lachnospiraceae bacterium NE2001]